MHRLVYSSLFCSCSQNDCPRADDTNKELGSMHRFFASRKTAPANRIQAKMFERARKTAVAAERKAEIRMRQLSKTACEPADEQRRRNVAIFNAPREQSGHKNKTKVIRKVVLQTSEYRILFTDNGFLFSCNSRKDGVQLRSR